MIPDPLHPAIVHMPIAIALLVPIFALVTAVGIWRRWLPPQSWGVVLLLQVLLVWSAWLAVETGEHEEERVEHFVAERHIEAHEEGAERFLGVAGAVLFVIGSGLLPGRFGGAGRGIAVVAALFVLGLGAQVGHTGGELVYRHGAASAYVADSGDPLAGHRATGHPSDD